MVDLAPPERRGRLIGLYGLAIWGGLSLGPPIGELILHEMSFEGVWAFAAGAPLLGALIATRIPERYEPRPLSEHADRRWIAREALRPGIGLALAIVGYATVAAFIVLHLDQLGIGHGAGVFTAFAVSVVAMRVLGGWLPDRFGSIPCAIGAALLEAAGLLLLAFTDSLGQAIAGAIAMGAGFSLMFPALALVVINRVPDERRGAAMGTFTAFFDLGVGIGSPIAGAGRGPRRLRGRVPGRRRLRVRRDRGRALVADGARGAGGAGAGTFGYLDGRSAQSTSRRVSWRTASRHIANANTSSARPATVDRLEAESGARTSSTSW